MDEAEMKVTYIDPDQRALFVAELPEGGWGLWTQQGQNAPRKLVSKDYAKPEGYATFTEAQEKLGLYVSNKRDGSTFRRWDVLVNGKRVSWDDHYAMRRGELPAPSALPPAALVTLANIEYRIATHIQGAYENLLEVGNCLIEAKESELVAHGEWEAWVRRNTNMSERQAQKLMQAARSVAHGSAMERLPLSKIQAILALPEPEREPMAEKATDAHMSLRELQEAVKARNDAQKELLKLKQEFNVRVDAEASKSISAAVSNAKAQSDAALRLAREDAERKVTDAQKREKAAADLAEQKIREAEELRNKLALTHQAAPSTGISADAQAKIDALRKRLLDAEDEAERQNELRQQAQAEMLRLQTDAARGEEADNANGLTPADIAAAVRAFIGSVGVLPHMAPSIAVLPEKDRQTIQQHIDMVADWVETSRRAMQAVIVDGVISI